MTSAFGWSASATAAIRRALSVRSCTPQRRPGTPARDSGRRPAIVGAPPSAGATEQRSVCRNGHLAAGSSATAGPVYALKNRGIEGYVETGRARDGIGAHVKDDAAAAPGASERLS